MLAEGKSEEQVLQHYVAQEGGMHILSEPPNTGLGRLSWLIPYMVGASGLMIAAVAALRWSRRSSSKSAAAPRTTEDPALGSRLDDELRDLD